MKRNKLKKCGIQYLLILGILILGFSCKEETKTIEYNRNQFGDLDTKILSDSTYEIIDNIKYIDYIKMIQQNEYCKQIDLQINKDYIITQSKTLLDPHNTNKRMSYEVVYFFDSNSITKLINLVKNNRCVDDFNLKFNKVYLIDKHTVILANYLFGYDSSKFNRDVKNAFKEVKIHEITN